jgi:hypothetical protein
MESTRWPLSLNGVTPIESTMRITAATSTGEPTTIARKTVRRDHNISPSDSSNTRQAPRMNEDERAGGRLSIAVIASPGT